VLDLPSLMAELSAERPVFHSEADFQHAIAWKIREKYPTSHIRLEYPTTVDGTLTKRFHLDLWIRLGDHCFAVELKYGTFQVSFLAHGEEFDLRNQSQDDGMRYNFVRDIERLERVVEGSVIPTTGYAVLLTNYAAFWKSPSSVRPCRYKAFWIHEDQTLSGTLAWELISGADSIEKGKKSVSLKGKYSLRWHDYSNTEEKGKYFRYVFVQIDRAW
jgi:hypothetical protein